MDDATRKMLDAHIAFEVARWTGDNLAASIGDEVEAIFDGLGGVSLEEIAPRDDVLSALLAAVSAELPEELLPTVREMVTSVHEALRRSEIRVSDVVDHSDYEDALKTVSGLRRLRREVIDQMMSTSVYAELVAHVLYHGIKDYLLTQNVFARKIPGASSMLRLGHSAVSAAAPGLERGVDKQLTQFISTNVAATVRDSGEFLERKLDDPTVRTVGEELWRSNAARTFEDLSGLVPAQAAADGFDTATHVWDGLRDSPIVEQVVTAAVHAFYDRHGDRPVADLLGAAGFAAAGLTEVVVNLLSPALRAAHESGLIEARVRARFEPFYEQYRR